MVFCLALYMHLKIYTHSYAYTNICTYVCAYVSLAESEIVIIPHLMLIFATGLITPFMFSFCFQTTYIICICMTT